MAEDILSSAEAFAGRHIVFQRRGVTGWASRNRLALVSFLLVTLAWLLFFLSTPPFKTPDETGHYAYVQSLASGHYPTMPAPSEARNYLDGIMGQIEDSPVGFQMAQAYHLDEKFLTKKVWVYNSPTPQVNSSLSDDTHVTVQAYHPPFFYAVAAVFYRAARLAGASAQGIFFAVRLASLLFYLGFVGVVWAFTRKMLGPRTGAYLTLALALQPTLLMVAISVNPDMASITLFSAALALLVWRLNSSGLTCRFAAIMAAVSAAATLTKFSDVIIIPIVAAAMLFCWKSGLRKKC